MTEHDDDLLANIIRREMMMSNINQIKSRMQKEKDDMTSTMVGSGKARNKDLAKRTDHELKNDVDDILACSAKFEGEATQCRTDAKMMMKEIERRRR